MTLLSERSLLIFGNSSISNSLCSVLAESFDLYYLPNFPIVSGHISKNFMSDLTRRFWLRECTIITNIFALNNLLSDNKFLGILSSCSNYSISCFSEYIRIHTQLNIYHMTSSSKCLGGLLDTLNNNVIPCYPNIATEYRQSIIKIVGKYIIDIPVENLTLSSQIFIETFNRLTSSVFFNSRPMKDLFRARFLVTTFTYTEILYLLSPIVRQRNYSILLEGFWEQHENSIRSIDEYNFLDLKSIKYYSRYLISLDPELSDISWITRTLVFDKSYKMERFIHAVINGI